MLVLAAAHQHRQHRHLPPQPPQPKAAMPKYHRRRLQTRIQRVKDPRRRATAPDSSAPTPTRRSPACLSPPPTAGSDSDSAASAASVPAPASPRRASAGPAEQRLSATAPRVPAKVADSLRPYSCASGVSRQSDSPFERRDRWRGRRRQRPCFGACWCCCWSRSRAWWRGVGLRWPVSQSSGGQRCSDAEVW